MPFHQRIRILAPALFIVTILLAGCAVPLGPGFRFASRQTNIGQVSAASFRVHVRVTDQLTNGGTRSLAYLDVALAAGDLDTPTLSILVDGKKAEAAPLTREPGAPVRIHFEPPWPQGHAKSFVFDYDLAPGPGSTVTAAAPGAFYLADPNALPRWLPPAGFFVTADSQARREEFDVAVPSAFRVVAAGSEQRPKQQGDLTIHRFRLKKEDFPLFVVAGRYQETPVRTDHGNVIFWTLHPLDGRSAQSAAERLAGAAATYEKVFGPASKARSPIRIIEIEDASGPLVGDQAPFFPYGAFLGQRALAGGPAGDPGLALAESGLARTWFGWTAQPGSEDQILLGQGAGLFAMVIATEARGGQSARRDAIVQLLAAYDRNPAAENIAVAKAVKGAPPNFGYKAALFWVALEDQAGAEPLQRATRHMLQALAGKEITVGDFRAALESETGHDLADVFHTWIDHPGLPADFRARYTAAR